jgi:hypothetical protein
MAEVHGPNDTIVGSTETYFAAKDANDCASVLLGKADTFFNVLRSNNYLDKLQDNWRFYYGAYLNDYVGNGHRVNFTGEQGELTQIPINHYRNLAQHIYTMITSSRPTMDARAVNTDYKSYAQTILANQILDYYMREKKLEDCLKRATEMAIVMGQGYVKLAWNATAGEIYDVDPETQQPIRDGELEYTTLSALDVIVDGTMESWDERDWVICRTWINKYDLMAKYPQFADQIHGMKPKNQSSVYRIAVWSNDDTDKIAVYEFFHKVTESMPEGRYMLFCDAEIVLIDAKMPYREIPVYRITPNDILGTPYGYSPMFDIYPIQEGINALYSTIMTNQNTFGVQNIWMPEDADIQVASLEGGMNVIKSKAKPEALNLTQTPAEVFKFLDMLIQAAETISGVNSVARGNPEASLKSGTALALVQSQALQFISGLQANYVKLIEAVGTGTIQILKDFANTPKFITLVGKNNRNLTKEFTGEKISAVNRVVVDMGNPLARTIAGRVQMAEQMMQMKIIKNPQQYFQVINTGRIEAMYEGETDDLMLIKKENEQLMDGINPPVSPMDKHSVHIDEHSAVLADPDLRSDAAFINNVMDHIQGHMNALRNTDPALLQIRGEQPLPPLQPQNNNPPGGQPNPPPPQNPPQASMQGGGPGGGGPTPPMMQPGAGAPKGAGQVTGPGIKNEGLPKPASVHAGLLANPAIQQQAMGNVKP